jgi:hypothetical protein
MVASLTEAESTLKVARKQLLELKKDISELSKPQTEFIPVRRHPRRPEMVRAKLPKRTDVLSAQVGDLAMNLQSALNQLVAALWELDCGEPPLPHSAKFPICQEPKDWKSCINRDLEKLSTEHQALIETLQPYRRCHRLGLLPDLANQHKHAARKAGDILAITATGDITWELSHHVRIPRDPTASTEGDADFKRFVRVDPRLYVRDTMQVQSHITGEVVFRESGEPVIQLLEILNAEVADIVAKFEPLFD